jgi:hypothetical protein
MQNLGLKKKMNEIMQNGYFWGMEPARVRGEVKKECESWR